LDAEEEGQELAGNNVAAQKESAWAVGEPCQMFGGKNGVTYFTYFVERIWVGDFEIKNVGDLAGYTRVTGNLSVIHTDLVDRLQRDFSSECRRLHPGKKIILVAQDPVIGQVASCLPHHPDGSAVGGFTMQGFED